MHPFPGAIGRFRMHGARILPPKALFRVEEPEITHGAKVLPAPPGLSAAAACGMAERALRHAAAACDTRHGRTGFAPCGAGLACLPHAPPVISLVPAAACAPAISPAFIAAVLHAPRFAVRDPPRGPRTDASRYLRAAPIPPAARAHRVQETSGTTQATNASIKIGSPNGDPIEELFGFTERLPDAPLPLHQANELALSYLDHSTRQRLGGYVIGLSGNSFTVDLYAALVDHATSIAR